MKASDVRTYCITRPETPDRTDTARSHFEERGLALEFVIGSPSAGLHTDHLFEADFPALGIIDEKDTGTFLSHVTVWTVARHDRTIDEDDLVLILEDDALFPEDWRERFDRALADTPADADMLFIGSCCAEDKPRRHIAGDVWCIEPQPIPDHLRRPDGPQAGPMGPMCLHAYAVRKRTLPTLIATQRELRGPIDVELVFLSFPSLNVYTVLPRIIDQRDRVLRL